ncbi:geraniol 8-hydroxylase-like [Lotus japonicus]|uniref:geraniol 8-hydroxylase-like n=1 Tax=Lotus japonicus TaxID=34305 RepID=UPI00258A16AD|nr:geraniol 8-hydroxylase-like [Lotus japonicus]
MEYLSSILLLVLTFILTQAVYSRITGSTKPKYKLPPGPYPLPIIGNILSLGQKPHKSLAKLAKVHGPIMSLKLGQVTTIVISSPDMAKEVLLTHDNSLSNRVIPQALEVHDLHKHSITFQPISPLWRNLRKICKDQLFSNKSLDTSQDLRREKMRELVDEIHCCGLAGEVVDLGKITFKTAINMLSNTVFSVDLVHSQGSAGDFRETVMRLLEDTGKPNMADFFPALRRLDPQGIKSRNSFSIGKMLEILGGLIDQRVKLRQLQGFDNNMDMLNTLLNIAHGNNQDMNPAEIGHLSVTLFAAGTDTITSTLEWAMAELLRNENAMSKVKQEMEQIIGKGKLVEESDVARLPYLQAVLKETFRLHPLVPLLIPRKANETVEISGYTIPKDATILVNQWAMGRNSSVWENAELFSPERFVGSEIDIKGHHYQLTPFGGGRRICLGMPLAIRTLYLMLGSLINCFNWRLEDGLTIDDIDMEDKFGLTLVKAQPMRLIPHKISN